MMRAEVLGHEAGFEVSLEQREDGSWAPPAEVKITLRPCWRKPAIRLRLIFLYTNEERKVAVYDILEAS
jgi:hypothetical protein